MQPALSIPSPQSQSRNRFIIHLVCLVRVTSEGANEWFGAFLRSALNVACCNLVLLPSVGDTFRISPTGLLRQHLLFPHLLILLALRCVVFLLVIAGHILPLHYSLPLGYLLQKYRGFDSSWAVFYSFGQMEGLFVEFTIFPLIAFPSPSFGFNLAL